MKSSQSNSRQRRTFSQVGYIVAEGAAYLIFSTVLIVLISRIRGPEFLGQYAVMLSWITIMQGLAAAGIAEIVLREIGRDRDHRSVILLHGLLIGLSVAAVSTVAMLAAIHALGYTVGTAHALTIASLGIMPGTVMVVCRSAFVVEGLSHVVFRITCIELVLVQSVNAWLVYDGARIDSLAITIVSGKVLACILALYWSASYGLPARGVLSAERLRGLASPLPTFTLIRLFGLLFWRLDIIMLSRLSTLAVTGAYASATKFFEILSVLPAAYSQVTMGRRAKEYRTEGAPDHRHLEVTLGWLFALLVPALSGVAVFAEPLMRLLFGPDFDFAVPMLQLLMLALVVLSIDLVMGMLCRAARRESADLKILAIMASANVVLNFLLIPKWQGVGAAAATLFSACLSLALHAWFLHRSLGGVRWARGVIAPCVAALPAAAIIFSLLGQISVLILLPGFGVVYFGALVVLAPILGFQFPPLSILRRVS